MKIKSFLILSLAGFLSFSTFASDSNNVLLSGDSNTELGKFTITKSDKDISVKDSNLEVYLLDYENGERPIYIAIDQGKKCKNFIVRSKHFEIQYKCKKNKFGVTYMQPKYTSIDPDVNSERLNEEEFSKQRILSSKQNTDEEIMKLIACYFPSLLKDNYKKALV